ncbi:PAS domain-containing protein [Thiohalobacter thiocyanaticus]|uniref:histidine kinase n=2 Tax=Thiohalobacter thiocyanaticus TaxID=585455 RepID=A0A426QKB1_9GAMM|nr:PAS domain-containing protein [Thiohalobacter thiocyanaticus]
MRVDCALGMLISAVGVVVALILVFYSHRLGDLPGFLFLLPMLLLLAVLVFFMYRMIRYRQVLGVMHSGMHDAQDGILSPVDVGRVRDPYLKRLISDYNSMMTSLRRVFSTVEECQNRFLAERNRINAVLQSLPGALLSVDDNLCINAVNSQAEAMFGASEEELVGRSLFDLLRLSESDRNLLRDAFLYKRHVSNQEINILLKGERRYISLNLSFITQTDPDMGAVITLQDISDYKRLQENVYNQEKLVAMGELAAGVAHELNTPLGSIVGYAQLLRDAMGEDRKTYEWTRIICDEARRCSRIIDDLLHYARSRDECNNDVCEINDLVRVVSETFVSCRMKRYNIDVRLNLPEGEIKVEGGCGQLEIVLVNLMSNSIQALAGQDDAVINIKTELSGDNRVRLLVEDNGPGIPEEVRNRIFDPFFTTKDVGSGSGLGLAICQAMLNRRGASIWYDASYKDGARFIVELPRVLNEAVT